jgi:hypothetical protein
MPQGQCSATLMPLLPGTPCVGTSPCLCVLARHGSTGPLLMTHKKLLLSLLLCLFALADLLVQVEGGSCMLHMHTHLLPVVFHTQA